MFIYVITVLLGLVTFHVVTRYNRKGRLANKLPGPPPLPIVGNLLKFNTTPEKLFYIVRDILKNYYPYVTVWLFTQPVIVLQHPDDIEILLSSQKTIEKGYIYDYIQAWLKTGLLTSKGEKWRLRRKILTPAFHFQILKKYMEITNEQIEKLIGRLKGKSKENVESLLPLTSNFTLNIICESAMGVSFDKIESTVAKKYVNAIYEFGEVTINRSIRPYLSDWMLPVTNIGKMQSQSLKVLHEFTDKVVKDRREYHESTENKYLQEIDSNFDKETIAKTIPGYKKRLAMLDLLLLAEKKGIINEEGIKEEVDTFTFEGHDTTGMALAFLLMLLAENKEAQDKARDEARKIIEEKGGNIDLVDIQELNYIERCIKESLRLFPPVPGIMRYLTEDLHLKNHILPAETNILLFFFDLHRDPNFWPNPEKFDPDRFLPEESAKRHPFAYLPFSAGPRNCIGQKFAMMELKSLTAHILYDFYLEPVDRLADIRFITDIILRPAHPINIKFIKINKK